MIYNKFKKYLYTIKIINLNINFNLILFNKDLMKKINVYMYIH